MIKNWQCPKCGSVDSEKCWFCANLGIGIEVVEQKLDPDPDSLYDERIDNEADNYDGYSDFYV